MSKQQPNKIFAPLVIAGVTIGFLASAYKFIFADATSKKSLANQQDHAEEIQDKQDSVSHPADPEVPITPK